ncbi:RICIN domain-containing protein [Paenibacillus sp. S-38]|uniref:RICIN domain-containing protein n=1 Tax=Paenibacillus sp. S-38 TaxID=3416710 RepID=UPI003CEA00D3
MIYNHYANRKGLSVPNIAARAQRVRPEGGPNSSHASTFDQPGFGTLLYTRPASSGGTAALPGGNIASGTYRFVARPGGKVLHASGTTNGTPVQSWTPNSETSQQWVVTHLGGDQYSIMGLPLPMEPRSSRKIQRHLVRNGDYSPVLRSAFFDPSCFLSR